MRSFTAAALGTGLLLAATTAFAGASEEEIARLGGPELTPVGAERAGNKAGTIPEWTGGVTRPPAGWQPGQKRIDTFADDKVLFTIDAGNVDRHADKLTPGQVALIKSYEGYTMNVYPSRRSCAFPERDYEMAKQNARDASVDDECFLTGGLRSPVFPLPKTGCELIQNGKLSDPERQALGLQRPGGHRPLRGDAGSDQGRLLRADPAQAGPLLPQPPR